MKKSVCFFLFCIFVCFCLFCVSFSYADEVTGSISAYSQNSTTLNFVVESVSLTCSDVVLFPPLVDAFNRSASLTFDYVAPGGALNYFSSSDPVGAFPFQELAKIYSFVVGAIACFCLILGFKMRF